MKHTILVFFCLLSGLSMLAQQNKSVAGAPEKNRQSDSLPPEHNLQIIARNYGDSVVLRWAPAKSTLWYFANKSGYRLIRYEVVNKKIITSTVKELTANPIKPWTLDEWKRKAGRNDSLAAASAQLLYGKTPLENPQKKKNEGVNLQEAIDKKYELDNKHALALFLADQSPLLATGLGLRYSDKNIVKGKSYAYAVYALTDPKVVKSDTSGVLINTSEIPPIPVMPPVTVEESDRKVKFTWNRLQAGMYFSAYNYERSDDGGRSFHRLNSKPYVQLAANTRIDQNATIELNDSLPANYKKYIYRITGITPFGDPGKPSPNMVVMGRDKTPPLPPDHVSAKNIKNRNVRITWTKKVKEPDFKGYMIGKSDKASGPYIPLNIRLIPSDIYEFMDTSAVISGTNYYVVSAVDTAGNAGISVPAYVIMMDSIPPAQPQGLAGRIDSTGIVHIHWKLGKEPDLMGYLVYSANDKSHIFTPIAKDFVADTTFTDSITVRTLSDKVYYKVVAFDKNRNPSKYSDALEMKRPDKVPPVSPVFTKFLVSDSSVFLTWNLSSSNDVVSQALYRREKGKDWILASKLDIQTNSYTDKNVKKQTWYEYGLEAVDDAGLHSARSFPVNVRVYDSGRRPAVSDLVAAKSSDGKSITLSWKYPAKGEYWFVLYRSVNNGDLKTYSNLSSEQRTYTDANLKKGVYRYSLKVVYKDGGESEAIQSAQISVISGQ